MIAQKIELSYATLQLENLRSSILYDSNISHINQIENFDDRNENIDKSEDDIDGNSPVTSMLGPVKKKVRWNDSTSHRIDTTSR